MDLAHAALRDTENPADLCEREPLEVVEREDESFPLRHAANRLGQGLPHLLRLEDAHGALLGIGDGVADRERLARPTARQHLVEGGDACEADLAERGPELGFGHAQGLGELRIGGSTTILGLKRGDGLLEVPGLGADRTRNPVDRAKFIEDRALDAGDRVRLERKAPLRIELLDCVDKAERPVARKVGLLDVAREAHTHPAGDVLHQRCVVHDQLVADLR